MIEFQILIENLSISCSRDPSTTISQLKETIMAQFKEVQSFKFQIVDIYQNVIDVEDDQQSLKQLRVRSGDSLKLIRKQSVKPDLKYLKSNSDIAMQIEQDNREQNLNLLERQLMQEFKIKVICEELKSKDKQIQELNQQISQIPIMKTSIQSILDSQYNWSPFFQEFQINKDSHLIRLERIPEITAIIKVHLQYQSGNNPGHDSCVTWIFATKKDQLRITCHPYQQSAWNSSSDNCILCLDETRIIDIKRTGEFPSGNFKMSFVVLGYK